MQMAGTTEHRAQKMFIFPEIMLSTVASFDTADELAVLFNPYLHKFHFIAAEVAK